MIYPIYQAKMTMSRIITYWDYKEKRAFTEEIRADRYDDLLDKVKELLWDTWELISISRKYE